MKKRWKIIVCLGLILIVVLSIVIYTRPTSMQQLCGEIDWTKCDRLKVFVFYVDGKDEVLMIEKEDAVFKEILKVFEGKKFRKSLWNVVDKVRLALFPDSIRFTYGMKAETDWIICFDFDEAQYLSDGSGHSGEMIQVMKLDDITLDVPNTTWSKPGLQLKVIEKEKWMDELESLIIP